MGYKIGMQVGSFPVNYILNYSCNDLILQCFVNLCSIDLSNKKFDVARIYIKGYNTVLLFPLGVSTLLTHSSTSRPLPQMPADPADGVSVPVLSVVSSPPQAA